MWNRGLSGVLLSCAVAVPGWASTINGAYTFTVIEQSADSRPGFRGVPVINDAGDTAFVDLPTGATFDVDTVSVLSRTGVRQDFTIPFATRISEISINDAGQIAVLAGIGTGGQVDIIVIDRATGAQTTVATSNSYTGLPEYAQFQGVEISDTGDIAVIGYTNADRYSDRVLRIDSTGAITTLDVDAPGHNVNSLPTIDDAGNIAWSVQKGVNDIVVLNDGATTTTVFDPPSASATLFPVLNNSGQLLTQTGSGLAVSDITDGDITDTTTQGFGFGVGGTDLNDFGQVVYGPYAGSSAASIELDGEVLISITDPIDGYELANLGSGGMAVSQGQWLNDLGQVVFDANAIRTDGSGTQLNLVIRADPIGGTPDNPILPGSTEGNVNFLDYAIVNGLGLEAPIFVDPLAATVFDYAILSGPAITSLFIPTQDLGIEDGLFEILCGSVSRIIGFDEALHFTAIPGFAGGLFDFTVAGIDIGSSVTPSTPFVVGLTHAGLGEVSLQITGRDVTDIPPVPVPASLWLLLGALGGLGGILRNRSCRRRIVSPRK